MHKTPPLSDKLKLIFFDNSTFAKLERPYLTISEWYTILSNISRQKPRAIIISKIFFDVPSHDNNDLSLDKIAKLGTNIVAGVFLTPRPIKFRPPMETSGQASELFSWPSEYQARGYTKKDLLQFNGIRLDKSWNVYGPNRLYLDHHIFGKLGHLSAGDTDYFAPLFLFGKNLFIPHISVYAATNRKLANGHLELDETIVPLQSNGTSQVNYILPDYIYDRALSLKSFLEKGDNFSEEIKKDDVVLILTEMFTGGTNFIQTPFDQAPSAFSTVSILNSVLVKSWLSSFDYPIFFIILGALGGATLNLVGSAVFFGMGLICVVFLSLAIELFLFSYLNICVSLIMPTMTFSGIALTIFAYLSRLKELKILELKIVEVEKKRLESEMKDAAIIAKALLPDNIPDWPFCRIGVYHKPFSEASGDWFGFASAPSKKAFHFILCDITGHGVQGAIVASTCKSILSLLENQHTELLENDDFCLQYALRLNATLFKTGQGNHMLTMFAVTFIPDRDLFYFLSAGHPMPVFLTQTGEQKSLLSLQKSRPNPLGFEPTTSASLAEYQFKPGDRIITFTDGVPLKHNVKMSKLLGEHWKDFLDDPREIYSNAWKIERKKSGNTPDDDVSIVSFVRPSLTI